MGKIKAEKWFSDIRLSDGKVFSSLHSSNIDTDELEKIIYEAVKRDNPKDSIKEISYTEDGVVVVLDGGQTIEIEINWNEIILNG